MRISRVRIQGFKNLADLTVQFDAGAPISVVVGRNGSGKSNFIEALTVLFRDLDLGLTTGFAFDIEYSIRNRLVRVSNELDRTPRRRIWVDGSRSSMAALTGARGEERLLPDFVFGYYSGPTNRLEKHFILHQTAFNRALREGDELPLRRLFYARPEHSQFVLLAFFLADEDPAVRRFLNEHLRIESFESALFELQQPQWKGQGGDARFWNARGAVAELLSQLYELSMAPLKLDESGRERLYLYLPDLESLHALAERYERNPQRLFAAFESVLAAELLNDLRVKVRSSGSGGSLTFRELSEGEQQLLMVLGLLRFTREEESLFLLDEPDTHLNPAWGLNYTQMLVEHSGNRLESGQIVMASHDPLVVASLLAREVVLLERDPVSGAASAKNPDKDPRGMGVSALLTSEVYGLASELDPVTYRKLERRRWLAASDDLSNEESAELIALTGELERLDFTVSNRDPLYAAFEQAMMEEAEPLRLFAPPSVKRADRAKANAKMREILADSDPGRGRG